MFQWPVFLIIVGACLPGLFLALPGVATVLYAALQKRTADKLMLSKKRLTIQLIVQQMALVIICAAIGTKFSYQVDLNDKYIDQLVGGLFLSTVLIEQITVGVFYGGVCAIIFLLLYYGIFYQHVDQKVVETMGRLQKAVGFWGRVLYRGIVAEVIARWGLQTLLVWLGGLIVGSLPTFVYLLAIIMGSIIFSVAHLQFFKLIGYSSMLFTCAILVLNGWASFIFGFLFWQHGLIAAISAHVVFLLIWMGAEYLGGKVIRKDFSCFNGQYF